MKTIKIEAHLREDTGKGATKRLRREGMVPCVIYGGNDGIVHFYAYHTEFNDLINSPSFVTATIKLDGKEIEAIVKEEQYHPVSDALLHIDFRQLTKGQPVVADIPIRTEGRAVGVLEGGKLLTKVRKLRVRATPEHLTEYIDVDVSDLDINKSIKVSQLNREMEGVEILTAPTIPVATVVTPRALRSAAMKQAKEAGLLDEGEAATAETTESAEGGEAEGGEEGAES